MWERLNLDSDFQRMIGVLNDDRLECVLHLHAGTQNDLRNLSS